MAKLQKIVCALDLSEHSKLVAEYATMLAKMSGASIVAVYAAPTLTQYTGFHVPPNTIDSFVGEIVSGAEKAARPKVEKRMEPLESRNCISTSPLPSKLLFT